ncbi:SusC/RagA family TonB-linked outer membrane protein [Mucilaginibacter galii]|uniref:SusC/RagA family TonB-linked outer membrane protein n=1 Tax=Mucilaginibacter galii TaxID=2005073 RepID=A0A917J9M8_9SPHI|nr:SusC/RagA family TonB-linked outer membrane protein [Mucilaginibacter galii]GGI51548.1 SusC/RagA family TonB-linked outer membrane protein [Mucilaginibacter galii]
MKKILLILLALSICVVSNTFAQGRKITGKVTGADDGQPLPGVSVVVKGSTSGTQTDPNGNFTLNVPTGATTLVINYVGFVTQEVSISGTDNVTVSLRSDVRSLNEVVVSAGYQSLQRKDLPGAVSIVGSKEVEQKPIASFTQLLQGTAPGLQVTGSSGRPGANAYIRIRGTGSITASSEPLIIVDGVQVSTTAYNGLNPNDIENVVVLKDADATAIYGSRAGNGVLVVNTKQGRPGAPTVRYSFQYGKTQAQKLKNVSLMNAQEKLQYEYELGFTNGTIDTMITNRGYPAGTDITTLTPTQRTDLWNLAISRGAGDWRDYLLQNATTKTHELALSGGADKIKYYLSGNISDYPGVERFSTFKRKGGRLNVEYQIKDWFKLGTNIGVTQTHDNRVREAYNSQNSYGALFFFNPYEQVYNADGSYNTTLSNGFSPLEGAVNNPVSYDRLNQFGTFFGEARFFKHLLLRSQYGINYNTLKYQSYLQPGSNLASILGYNQKQDQIQQDFFYTFTNTANWLQTIADKHNINILAGTEYNKSNLYSLSATGRGFPSKDYTTLENAATPTAATTSINEFALISYFGRVQYDFDKRYSINLSGRRDGSSRFGANVRFANFYAVGAGWDLRQEKFFTLPEWVTDLKLRGSYGTSGNNNIGNYEALGTYSLTGRYNDQTAAVPARLANPNLTWETTYAKDIGLTYGFLDGRITGEIDYYSRNNKNLLYQVQVSQTTGFSSYTGNIGAVRNYGVEFAVTGNVIRKKDFRWDVTLNYTHNDNEISELYVDNASLASSAGFGQLVVGQPIGTFYLTRYKGVNPANGKAVYYNRDGSETETYPSGQEVLLNGKSPNVKYYGTVGTNLFYKGIDFSARLYYSGGNYIYNQILQDATSNGSSIQSNQFTEASNYWKKPGDVVLYPNPLDPTQATVHDSDQYLEKGDYVTLRDVTLGYTLNNKLTNRLKVKSIRVFAQGTNLAVWTKFKGLPEVGDSNNERTDYPGTFNLYGYPPIKGYTFGIDVRF